MQELMNNGLIPAMISLFSLFLLVLAIAQAMGKGLETTYKEDGRE